MDDETSFKLKPVPLPRRANKNTVSRDANSLTPPLSTAAPSDINSNIDTLMEPKPNISKFTSANHSSPHKPVPLPRKFVRSNGTHNQGFLSSNMPDLTNFSSGPQSITGSVKSEDYDEDLDDDIDYENIPSRANMPPTDVDGKRSTINIFNRDVGDPFKDFDASIKETEPLSTITFRSPIEDLDEAARSRISISSLSSSTTTTSKSSYSDYSDHYMEPPPARPLPVELTMGDGRWRSGAHTSYSSNTVPSKPKRSPHIILPRLSSLEEGEVLTTSPKSTSSPPPSKRLVEKIPSCHSAPPSKTSSTASDPDLCYEPISWRNSTEGSPLGSKKFNTISSCSTNAIRKSRDNFVASNNAPSDSEYAIPVNSNFTSSKRVTVPNVDRTPFHIQSSLTNHSSTLHAANEDLSNRSNSPIRKFDPTSYDVSDVHRVERERSPVSKKVNAHLDGGFKRRSLTTPVSGHNSDTGSETEGRSASSVILRRHSSGRSTSSSVGTSSSTNSIGRNSSRDSYSKRKVHEYDEVAIEDGTVVFLSQSDSSATLNNNSCSSLNSRNSVVQEFDPLLYDIRGGGSPGLGFAPGEKSLDLNDSQQHRYEYIDADGEDGPNSLGGSSTNNEGSPVPSGIGSMCMENPGYAPSPLTSRSAKDYRSIDETYEPVGSPKDGISPKLSPKPRMGTRALRKSDDGSMLAPPPTSPPVGDDVDASRNLLQDPLGLGVQAPPQQPSNQPKLFRLFSSKIKLKPIKEEKDRKGESLLNSEEMYGSITTACQKCFEPHPESTKCKFSPAFRENIFYASNLHKTSGLAKKEFSKKWAVLAKSKLTFYNDKKDVIQDIPLDKFLVVSKKNDYRVVQSQSSLKCFEMGFTGGKSSTQVFATEQDGERSAWMQKFIEVFTWTYPTNVLSNFDRGGWCFIKETVTSDWRPCWLLLKDRSLYYSYWKGDESIQKMDLRKARSICLSQKEDENKFPYLDNGDVLTVDFICKLLFIQTESSKATSGWVKAIKASAAANGSEFHEMQLTLENVPVIVGKCIDFLDTHGTLLEGIYRQSGSNTRITQLLQDFKNDAWSVQLLQKDFSAHDVAGTLRRFFRTLPEPLVTLKLYNDWIKASSKPKEEKPKEYMRLLDQLPDINYNIMKKLMCHLYAVHDLREMNLMPLINLAPIWGPTLMNVDSSQLAHSYEIVGSECDVIKDLIENCYTLFQVDPEEIAKEEKIREAVRKFHRDPSKRKCSGDMKIWIYVWDKDDSSSINITLTPNSTAQSIVQYICSMNKIRNVENVTLYEVICNETLERPLHPSEKVIETALRWSIWVNEDERKSNYLILKKNTLYPSLVHYAKEPKTINGELKYADSKSKSFRKFTFLFSQPELKYFKDSKLTTELGSWKIGDIVWYLGCEPKRNAPTRWTFTIAKQHYKFKRSKEEPFFGNVIACASEDELHKWIGALVIGEHPEGLNPIIV